MIVVDTTVWADWFNGAQTPEVDRLDRALGAREAGLTPLILTEILQGFRAGGGVVPVAAPQGDHGSGVPRRALSSRVVGDAAIER